MTVLTVLAVLAVSAVSVVTATPLNSNPFLRCPEEQVSEEIPQSENAKNASAISPEPCSLWFKLSMYCKQHSYMVIIRTSD